MQRGRSTDELRNLVPVWRFCEVVEEPLTAAEQQGRVRQMHLVDQPGAQLLLDRGDATGEPHVLPVGRLVRPLQGC
jgi:hypothetical protein